MHTGYTKCVAVPKLPYLFTLYLQTIENCIYVFDNIESSLFCALHKLLYAFSPNCFVYKV